MPIRTKSGKWKWGNIERDSKKELAKTVYGIWKKNGGEGDFGKFFETGKAEESEEYNKEMKSITEDKLLTKEDEGAAPMGGGEAGGEITPPSPGGGQSEPHPFTNDVIPTVPMTKHGHRKDGSVTIDDVLGDNPVKDKKCTGFFANGSFHVPFPIFTIPSYRLTRKYKKRKPKVIDLTEGNEYQDFVDYCKKRIQVILEDAEKDMWKLDDEITVVFDEDYDFSDYKSDWVAALNKQDQTSVKEFIIGINFPILYEYLKKNDLEDDFDEIDCQLKASVYHELGHAIIQFFEDTEYMDFELSQDEEEKAVEEYANFKLREYTKVNSSSIQNFIDEVIASNEHLGDKEEGVDLNETNAHDTDIEKYSPPVFTLPINIKNRRIVPEAWKEKLLNGQIRSSQISRSITVTQDENILTDGKNTLYGTVSFLLVNGIKGVHGIVRIQNDDKTEFFIPTLIDIIRLSNGKINTLPLSYLSLVDDTDNSKGYDSFNTESIYDDIKNSEHLKSSRTERYNKILSMYTPDTISKSVMYSFVISKRSGGDDRFTNSMGVILKEGVYLAYYGKTTAQGIQTAYFIEPCEIIANLKKCDYLHTYNGVDKSNVPVILLFNALNNIIEHNTYMSKNGSTERKPAQNRRYIEKTDN